MTVDVAERMRQVLGQPPRLLPVPEDALGDRGRELVERIRRITDFSDDEPVHPFFLTLAHQPAFFAAFMEFGMTAMASCRLGKRERELVILRTGWLCGAPYQFGEHVVTARNIGLTGDEIERIKQGSSAADWSERERALLRAAEELHADAMISDETWDVLSGWLDPPELIELPMIVGHYHVTAFLQNTLRFRLNPGRDGLAAS